MTARAKAAQTMRLTSFALRILWAGWQIGKGRTPTTEEVQGNKGIMLAMARNFLPELEKLEKKGQPK